MALVTDSTETMETEEQMSIRLAEVDYLICEASEHLTLSKVYLPRLFSQDAALTLLDLQSTKCGDVAITALADALKANTVLQVLLLDRNSITSMGVMVLAEALRHNSSLTTLSLVDNCVDTRGVSALVSALEVNNSLTSIMIDGNPDVGKDAKDELLLMTQLNAHPVSLKTAILSIKAGRSGNTLCLCQPQDFAARHLREIEHDEQVHVDDWGATALAHFLSEDTTVTELDLSRQHIGDEGARSISEMLLKNRTIDRIDLCGNVITAAGAQAFIAALEQNSTLRYLTLHQNPISETVLVEVEKAVTLNRQPQSLKHAYQQLIACSPQLHCVVLDDHKAQRFYDDVSARLIAEAIMNNAHLKSLSINNSQVTLIGARFLSDVLMVNTTLQTLDLGNNPLGEGSSAIAKALLSNRTLLSLRLNATQMTSTAACDFAEMLEVNSTLTELDMSCNELVDERAGVAIAECLNTNTTLQTLNLKGTDIPQKVMRVIEERRCLSKEPVALRHALKRILQRSDSFTCLTLGGAPSCPQLGDSSLRILAPALCSNYSITKIDFSHNSIGYSGFVALSEALLENNVTLEVLDLSHNPINKGYDFGKVLASILRVHRRLAKVDISFTGLDDDGCEPLLQVVDVPTINVVRSLTVDGNPMVSNSSAFKIELYVACNSLHPNFKCRARAFFHQWEEDDARALYERHVADFSGYLEPDDIVDGLEKGVFDRAAHVVSTMMRRTKGYQVLRFRNNRLGDAGAAFLAELIAEDHGIKTLDISENHLTDDAVKTLSAAVRQSFHITAIDLDHNNGSLSKETVDELQLLLLYNRQPRPIKELLVRISSDDAQITEVNYKDRLCDHLDDSHVRLLCNALKANTNLTKIDLSNNHIHLEGFHMLVETLEQHPRIMNLTLQNTLIRGKEVGSLVARLLRSPAASLTHIDLSYNDLEEDICPPILDAVATNRSVKYIGLKECGLSQAALGMLTNSVSLNTNHFLKDLVPKLRANDPLITHINGHAGGYADAHTIEILAALSSNTHVSEVDFSGNGLTDVAGIDIMLHLRNNRCVKHLNLSRNKLTGATVAAIRGMLQHNNHLECIDLRLNNITDESLAELKSVVLKESWSLCKIVLWDGVWTPKCPFSDDSIVFFQQTMELNHQHSIKRAIPLILTNSEQLLELDASIDARHNDVGCRHLAQALISGANTFLTAILLQKGEVGDSGVADLCRGLVVNTTLTHLDLSYNHIGDDGAASIADFLNINASLTWLSVAGNEGITSSGAKSLHHVLQLNDSLQHVDVSSCPRIDEADTEAIAFLVRLNNKHPGLKAMLRDQEDVVHTELNLSDAGSSGKRVFDDDACKILVRSIKHNKFLTKLNLSHNCLTFESGYLIHDLLVHNMRLIELNLAFNSINDGAMHIVDALSKNNSVTSLNLSGNGCSAVSLETLELFLQLNKEPLCFKREILKIREKDITHSRVSISIPELRFDDGHRKPQLDDESVQLLTGLLRNDLIIREIDMSWNAIRDAGLISLGDLIRLNNGIHTIKAAHNFLSDAGVLRFCDSAALSQGIKSVDLRFNNISQDIFDDVSSLLHRCPQIVQFSLEGNKLSQYSIETINFYAGCNRDCGDGPMREGLIRAFKRDPQITELNFNSAASHGLWSASVMTLISFAMSANTTVTSLFIEFNDVDEAQLGTLCKSLRINATLRSLSLAQNKLEDPSILLETLNSNKKLPLQKLDLRKNLMKAPAAKAFASFIRGHEGIEELDVSDNMWGRFGATLLLGALPMNDSIKTIRVAASDIPFDLSEAVVHAASLHYREVDVADCDN